MAVMEVDRATIARAGTVLIEDVCLSVERGSSHVIVGPNGAGKSTLLLAMLGSGFVTAGSLRYDGEPYDRHRHPQRVRAYVGQTHDAHDDLLVNQAVRLYSGVRVTPAQARLGVAELWDARLGSLSAGQKARVFLAAAIAQAPAVLLLDEPTAFLDSTARESLLSELERTRHAGTAIVMVSHDHGASLPDSQIHMLANRTLN
jgi:ABC-type Mn2+/Zn2+ transport system ATPase subunit